MFAYVGGEAIWLYPTELGYDEPRTQARFAFPENARIQTPDEAGQYPVFAVITGDRLQLPSPSLNINAPVRALTATEFNTLITELRAIRGEWTARVFDYEVDLETSSIQILK